MKHVFRILTVVALIGFATTARAQVQTGSILVKAVDQQGGATPGVSVTISSPVLVSGTMTGVTDGGGVYRFPSLVPGTYAVKLELSGFQTIVREGLVVLVGQTTPIDVALKVATLAETVTVSGDSPVVDTTSANVNVNLSEQLLQGTPGGRDIWALVEYKVPSLTITRPDVGGTSGGLQGTYSARGTTSGQNSQYLNGINVGDPSAIGAAGYYYDFDAFDDIQVSTGAHDITVPTGGVFLNMVTKSGGNTWSGRTTLAWEGSGTQSGNIDDYLLKYGFLPTTNKVDFVSDANFSIGGPVIANKLRVFGSVRDWRVHVNVPAAFSTTVLDQTNIDSGLVNLTYQVNDKNRITGFYSKQRYNKPNRFLNSPTTTLVKDSTSDEEDKFSVYQALWNSVVTKNFFVDARLGYNTILFPTYLNGNAQSLTDNATGNITGNYTANTVRHRPRLQTNVTGNYYLDQALGGRHEFKFGIDVTHAAGQVETTRFDDLTANWNSQTNQAVNVTLYATPFQTASTLNNAAFFVQDSYSVNRLTVTGGLRYEHLHGYLPDQSSPPTRWTALGIPAFQNVPRTLSQTDVVTWNTTGPRLSAVYDLNGDGRTALKGSVARYYYIIATTGTPLDSLNPNFTYQATYGWNDANHDLVFQPGEQTGTPVITSGTTTSVDPNYRRPYTDEYTIGMDHDLGRALKVSAVYSYRREKYQQGTLNTSGAFATTLSTGVDTGPDGIAGTADDTTYQYYNR
ncbi:MAG TPA: TonB-dependent receptor, partial [Vicinamibacterales bacterium]|nr:TonB-dependent receptor [Vicinamibacterales bacterium]